MHSRADPHVGWPIGDRRDHEGVSGTSTGRPRNSRCVAMPLVLCYAGRKGTMTRISCAAVVCSRSPGRRSRVRLPRLHPFPRPLLSSSIPVAGRRCSSFAVTPRGVACRQGRFERSSVMRTMCSRPLVVFALGLGIGGLVPGVAYAEVPATPTFSKHVAPIFQEKCEACHRPGSIAPMSLRTFQEARPWARSIKARVEARQMPPWHIDKTVGIQEFKNDRSLSDEQIATIVEVGRRTARRRAIRRTCRRRRRGRTARSGTTRRSSVRRSPI